MPDMSWTEGTTRFYFFTMNDDLSKKYYKIRDVAELLGIPTSTIRFWETEFPELSPRRSKTNIRYYSPSDIELLRKINYLVRVRGLRLEAAREQLNTNRRNVSRRMECIEKLKSVLADLESMKSALVKRRDRD